MIYLIKDQERVMITDSPVDYIPPVLDFYIGEYYLGSTENISTTPLYIKFSITPTLLASVPEGEHVMILKEYGREFKKEMVKVWKDTEDLQSYTPVQTQIKQYGI